MKRISLAILLASTLLTVGCSSSSSSTVFGDKHEEPWVGAVFVSQDPLPASIQHKVVGSVQADDKVGYDGAVTLYPLLAGEARKIGANAVIGVTSGRRVTAFSWAAAYVNGTAVRVDDPEKLKGLAGSYH